MDNWMNLIAIALIIFALYCIGEIYSHCSDAIRKKRLEKEEEAIRIDAIASGSKIIDRPEFSSGMKKTIRRAVKVKIRSLRSSYFDANEVNIWTISIFTIQLQRLLEKTYGEKITVKEDCKEFVREIIKTCHLEAVRLYPEQKEY